MIIYYCITILINIISIFIYHESINITLLSLIPIILIASMIIMVNTFKHQKIENGFRTAYGSQLKEDQENDILKYNSKSLLIAIPWLLPFIFFFPSPAKVLSILVYLLGLLGGLIFYRTKNKNKIIDMIDNEEKEKLEQEKKEELGKSK